MTARFPETYQWLLVPTQKEPQASITWEAIRLSGSDPLAERASKKLKSDESVIASFAPSHGDGPCAVVARESRSG